MRRALLVLLLPFAAFAACSDDPAAATPAADAGGSDATANEVRDAGRRDARADASVRPEIDAGVTAAELIDAIDGKWCETIGAYCKIGIADFDVEACLASRKEGRGPSVFRVYAAAAAGGKIVFDPAKALACFELLDASGQRNDENFNREVYVECIAAFRGTIPIGGSGCASSLECEEGFCDVPSGTCTAIRAIGEACADPNGNGDECARLGVPGSSAYCASGRCALTKAYFESCASDHECFSGLCAKTPADGSTCQPYDGDLLSWNNCFRKDGG